MNILLLAIGAALVNNVILSQFLGLCPFLGVSKSVNTATGMGAAVIFVMTIASFVTSVVYYGILRRFGLEYLNTIVFILVIAALVQFVEMFLKKKVKSLYESLGVILAGIRERLEHSPIPESFKGTPIVLITSGLMAIAFFGFSGLI